VSYASSVARLHNSCLGAYSSRRLPAQPVHNSHKPRPAGCEHILSWQNNRVCGVLVYKENKTQLDVHVQRRHARPGYLRLHPVWYGKAIVSALKLFFTFAFSSSSTSASRQRKHCPFVPLSSFSRVCACRQHGWSLPAYTAEFCINALLLPLSLSGRAKWSESSKPVLYPSISLLHCPVLDSTVLYCTMLDCTKQYSTPGLFNTFMHRTDAVLRTGWLSLSSLGTARGR
jgi:hypothetical protein